MSERILKVLLAELNTVRLTCQNPACKGVIELTVEGMGKRFKVPDPTCPLCNHQLFEFGIGASNDLVKLAAAIEGVKKLQSVMKVEFVIPESE